MESDVRIFFFLRYWRACTIAWWKTSPNILEIPDFMQGLVIIHPLYSQCLALFSVCARTAVAVIECVSDFWALCWGVSGNAHPRQQLQLQQ